MFRTIKKSENVRRGYQENPAKEGALEFKIGQTNGKDYIFFRIGKIVAQKAGFRKKDEIVLDVDEEGNRGVLRPEAGGWALQKTGREQEYPPLQWKATWQKDERHPYIKAAAMCDKVIAKNQRIEFYFPKGTTFGAKDAVVDELYEEHRDIVESGKPAGKKGKKNGHGYRREADKAPRLKDGKPYGRRHND